MISILPKLTKNDTLAAHRFCPHNIGSVRRAVDACSLDHVTRILVRKGGEVSGMVLVEDGNVMLYSDDDYLMDSVIGICGEIK